MKPVVLAESVAEDFVRVFRHRTKWSNLDAAERAVGALEAECLALTPRCGMPWSSVRRKRLRDGYLVFFTEMPDVVLVVALFHEREDWTALLARRLAKPDPA